MDLVEVGRGGVVAAEQIDFIQDIVAVVIGVPIQQRIDAVEDDPSLRGWVVEHLLVAVLHDDKFKGILRGYPIGQTVDEFVSVGAQLVSAILSKLRDVIVGDPVAVLVFHIDQHLLGIGMGV